MSTEEETDSFDNMTPEWTLHGEDGVTEPVDSPADESDLSTQDLERLYRQAMNAVDMADAVEASLGLEEKSDSEATLESSAPVISEAARQPQIPKMQPIQILEAALFVGGTDLTLKKLGRLLGENASAELLESNIEILNNRYRQQQRPYEIQFGEGGYRLAIHSDFERIRNRVYGLGPKDVKLTQEALQVLAMVAYRQPISRREILEKGPKSAGSLLNQLLRRELIVLERVGDTRNDVEYSTTDRFLEVFGLTELNDLPQPDDLTFK